MKKLLYLLVLSAFCGCSDMLDVEPENSVTYTNLFKTEKDFQSAVYQMHSFMKSFISIDVHVIMGMKADKTIASYNNIRNFTAANMKAYSSWKDHYDMIYVANTILDNAHRAEDIPKDRLDFLLGQAYYAKSIGYFSLSRIWGEAVITTNSTNMEPYAKSSKIDVINEAIANGLKAIDCVPVYEDMRDASDKAIKSRQFGCKGTVAAVLAHAYAWKGTLIDLYNIPGENSTEAYEQAVYWCGQIIDKKVGNAYELEGTIENLCKNCLTGVTVGASRKENILEFETDVLDIYYTNYTTMKHVLGWPVNTTLMQFDHEYEVNMLIYPATVQAMYEPTDDRRKEFFYEVDDPIITTTYAYPYKIRDAFYTTDASGWKSFRSFNSNRVFIRMADIILLRAECNHKLSYDADAISDLNEVRGRANATLYPAAGETDLKMAIFREREKELIFEGHRYYDVVRNGYYSTELSAGATALSASDIQDGALFSPVGIGAFASNTIMRQNLYWKKFE